MMDDFLREKLEFLYNKEDASSCFEAITHSLIPSFTHKRDTGLVAIPPKGIPSPTLTRKDMFLITYGDQMGTISELETFLLEDCGGRMGGMHILPFYPYTSDDGFSVSDYESVRESCGGSWDAIRSLVRSGVRVMADLVLNHTSVDCPWFLEFLSQKRPKFRDFYINYEKDELKLETVIRPRTSPVLTPFEMRDGSGSVRHVWTTFSADQVDLNYKHWPVLVEMLRILLLYVEHGVSVIRLDAVAFLWKEIGTTCLHLDQVHVVVQIMRRVLDLVAPYVVIITETNVPHHENVSYFSHDLTKFGDVEEAQLVYNFALPPLLAFSLLTGNCDKLRSWARSLKNDLTKSDGSMAKRHCFFNFTASHDGIGLRSMEGLLTRAEVDVIVDACKKCNGLVSMKTNVDGEGESPYELNCNFFSLLGEATPQRFIISQWMMMCMPGVPAIYIHSLIGSLNDLDCVKQTGRSRSINREKLLFSELHAELHMVGHPRKEVFEAILSVIEWRSKEPLMDPYADFSFPDVGSDVFCIEKSSDTERLLVFFNVTDHIVNVSAKEYDVESPIVLAPYAMHFIRPSRPC
jgi:glucosylglycerate phosphorylase